MPRTLCSLSPSLSAFLSGSANGDSNTRTQIQLRYVAHTNLPGISASLYWTTDWLCNELYSLQSTVYSWHSLQSSFFCSCSAFSYSLNLCFRAFSWHCLGHVRGPIWDLLVAESRLGQLGHNIYAVCVPGLPFGFSFSLSCAVAVPVPDCAAGVKKWCRCADKVPSKSGVSCQPHCGRPYKASETLRNTAGQHSEALKDF